MHFYLGVPEAVWLERMEVPCFASNIKLAKRKKLFKARTPWALDSGGFSELAMHGRWVTTPGEYVASIRRYQEDIGKLDWAASQDWMCPPDLVHKTGLTVLEHQRRTVGNYLDLRSLDDTLPIVPVLQGWERADYWAHVTMYEANGVDLRALPRVALGSIVRREHQSDAEDIVVQLRAYGISLHGLGVKTKGLKRYGYLLDSADSMSWSFNGRMGNNRDDWHPGCTLKTCARCPEYALGWREHILQGLDYQQTHLAMAAADG